MSAVLEARGRTTRSSAAQRRRWRSWQKAFEREALIPIGIALATALLAWLLVYPAKTARLGDVPRALRSGEIVNLNTVKSTGPLDRILREVVPDAAERRFVVGEVFRRVPAGGGDRPLENVGALAAIRLPIEAVAGRRDLPGLAARAAEARARIGSGPATVGLLTTDQFQRLKPSFIVRDPARFTGAFFLHALIILAAFGLMHVGLHATGRAGDRWLLPVAVALTGIGFAMLVSLRDPLRDQMLFTRFSEGTLYGGIAMLLCAIPSYERTVLRRLAFVPLLGALGLSVALVVLGRGPSGSDARVNLLGTQPMELIRVFLVLFLAGFFASRWALLRELDERPLGDAWYLRILKIPRLHHVLPVAIGVAASLLMFFIQRDLGPALLLLALFLSLYAITRREAGLAVAGLAAVIGAFAISHALGFPRTVSLRTAMWLDPWQNGQSHGDQIAHGLWAFASGGISGTGLGLGAPALVPAAHTDLILASIGEELGFLGVLACFGLFALLIVRGFRIARRAPEAYTMYLALGLTLGLAFQTLLIAGGVAGLAPLSGVVTPFLSYGRSAQIVHFATLGILWSLAGSGRFAAAASREEKGPSRLALAGLRSGAAPAPRSLTGLDLSFDRPRRILLAVIGVMGAAVLLKLAWIQIVRPDATFARGSIALQADGEYRYQYNPRLRLAAAIIPRGTITDRNGVLLATSRWKDVTDRRASLARLGVDIDRACLTTDERHYPFGGVTFHLLGDLVTRRNWGASNTGYVERGSDDFLSGYDDHAEVVTVRIPGASEPRRVVRRDMSDLVPLWRHRHQAWHPKVRELLRRDRDLKLTIDVRLQQRATALLRDQLDAAGLARGAVVVMDADNGELLASVSLPAPEGPLRGAEARYAPVDREARGSADGATPTTGDPSASPFMDRARFGLYPPGSTFKLVTAATALSLGDGLADARYECRALPGGRSGTVIDGRLVRDDEGHGAHGTLGMEEAMITSCNAYYAQLGRAIGWPALRDRARSFGVSTGDPAGAGAQRAHAIESAYGQAQVVASPLTMARVAATMAAGGRLPSPHVVLKPPPAIPGSVVVGPGAAGSVARMMRGVVERGTGRRIATAQPPIAGKTGTAQIDNGTSHAWFIGHAPYAGAGRSSGRRIAFSVLIENGGYGGGRSAELAARIVAEARRLGII